MRCLAKLRCRSVDHRTRVDEVDGIELIPAVVALIAARGLESADRARPLDVPIRERVACRGRERAERLLFDQPAVLVERPEEILRDARVIPRGGAREAVVADPEITK